MLRLPRGREGSISPTQRPIDHQRTITQYVVRDEPHRTDQTAEPTPRDTFGRTATLHRAPALEIERPADGPPRSTRRGSVSRRPIPRPNARPGQDYASFADKIAELRRSIDEAKNNIDHGQRERLTVPLGVMANELPLFLLDIHTHGLTLAATVPQRVRTFNATVASLGEANARVRQGRRHLENLIQEAESLARTIELCNVPLLAEDARAACLDAQRYLQTEAARVCRFC